MILRHKLILLATAAVILMLAALATVQMQQGQQTIVKAAEMRVARNIDMAWQILEMRQQELETIVDLVDVEQSDLDGLRAHLKLDALGVIAPDAPHDGVVVDAVAERFPPPENGILSGYIELTPDDLRNERMELRDSCMIDGELSATMALFSARALPDGRILVAAQVLTRSDDLIWGIQRGLFGEAFYGNKRIGTVTIFTGTRRTSTSVLKSDHTSAVGTHVSDEVAWKVLQEGESWIGPAVVVGTRYLSRYDPIREPDGRIIGMLYIGTLESRLLARKYQTVLLGVGSIVAVLLLTGLVAMIIIRLEQRAAAQRHRVRFEFLRVLGHELKAPINAVEGYLQMLEQQTLGPIPEDYGKMITRSVARIVQMRKLISDLLDMTRIEAGEKRRELVDGVDLAAAVRQSVETVQTDADARGIRIEIEAPDNLPMRADPGELSIICNNLLTNAVKYNRDGGSVNVKLERNGSRITLRVSDTGIGMTPEEQQKLFGEFVRIKNDKTKHILGSGLGLNILKKIVTLYDGDVRVESEPDVGSTFIVSLTAV